MVPLQLRGGRAKCLSRLVLPIRYEFSQDRPRDVEVASVTLKNEQPSESWAYKRIRPQDIHEIWRRSAYFTTDTSYALFGRAEYYKLQRRSQGEFWTRFSFAAPALGCCEQNPLARRSVTVEMMPPTVVLFETHASRVKSPQHAEDNAIFQIGFIYIDCFLSPSEPAQGESKVFLEDLIEFNERARCLWSPFQAYTPRFNRIMAGCELIGDTSQGNLSGIWSRALSYPVKEPGEEDVWLITDSMRNRSRAWIENCAKAHVAEVSETASKGGSDRSLDAIPLQAKHTEIHTGWLATTDYRAFVWTYAYIEGSLASHFGGSEEHPERFGHWVKLVNVDDVSAYRGNDTDSIEAEARRTTEFEREWARERTYKRWAHLGTYYGVSPHSGALLTCNSDPDPPIDEHFQTVYFDQFLLLQFLRVFAFQLSIRMARLSAEIGDCLPNAHNKKEKNGLIEAHREGFRTVRQMFMSFSSLYQFPLLSTQQQGVELYSLFRKYMDIDQLYRDVEQEIDAWDRVMAEHSGESVAEEVRDLTQKGSILTSIGAKIAAIGLPIAFLTLLFEGIDFWLALHDGGSGVFDPIYTLLFRLGRVWKYLPALITVILCIIAIAVVYLGVRWWMPSTLENRVNKRPSENCPNHESVENS